MDEEITGLKSLLQSLGEKAQAQVTHLAPEKLVAYHFGKLPSDEATRTQDHLVMCRECASLLLDLAAFCVPGEDESGQPLQAEVGAAWAALHARLQTAPQSPRSFQSSEPSLFQRLGELIFPPRPAYVLAVLLLGISLSLAVWIISLSRENQGLIARLNQQPSARDQDNPVTQKALAESRKEIEETQRQRDEARAGAEQLGAQLAESRRAIDELMRPQLNAPVVDLFAGETRAQGGERQIIELPTGSARFTLIIPASTQELNYPDYAIEIINQRGATVLTGKGLRRDPQSGFTIALPCRLLPAGQYRFRVYGISRGRRSLVLERGARIRYR